MSELERMFKGLADATRLRILNLLLHGELCVCDIQAVLELSQPNVSRHLTYLKNAGLVLDRREGARIFYRLAQPGQGAHRALFVFLKEIFGGSPALAADARQLRRAIAAGSCNATVWHPYSALRERAASRI